MRAVPVGVASMVPHVTVPGNGGVRSCDAPVRTGGAVKAGYALQRGGAVPQFPARGRNCGTAPVR
ncbi:hypothetical protein GCM10009601_06910 [Streptomyces thermospinosisporus]|uniref:Uncharacterized protein n=1 Tax=Streptomyces thermospinosisporus TaxID=161482 RepID=A0ABN1YJV0_9ACTN